MTRHFRIHPAVGVARFGNSPDQFFVGPETPGVPANRNSDGTFKSFRDASGRILRQGARFRVFEYDVGASGALINPRETKIAGEIVDIEWRVHLANRKSSFYVFDGQNGAEDNYIARSNLPAEEIIKHEPDRTNLRNAKVTEADRASLDIDPGETSISTRLTPAKLVELRNPNPNIPIASIGTLRLDDEGRLVVLGGYGESKSNSTPPAEIGEYASNDSWFDDGSDGSVKARIVLSDGSSFDADPAWVCVGPPKFAPAIGNVVTLYDTLWDTAVRKLNIPASTPTTPALLELAEQRKFWLASGEKTLSGFEPSYTRHIYPLLNRALSTRDVHVSGTGNDNYHRSYLDFGFLSIKSGPRAAEAKALREGIFDWMRDPDATDVNWKQMPRGLGDDHVPLESEPPAPSLTSFLTLTRIQHSLLREWANDNFSDDWPGVEPLPSESSSPTPDELDRAALENCVGGPFYPGIEVSWLVRVAELYSEPFRFKTQPEPATPATVSPVKVGALDFRPGFFSQQMAVPWQADFYDCRKERYEDPDGNELFFMWWTAQRPDDVFASGESTQKRWVRNLEAGADIPEFDDLENLDRFTAMQRNWDKLKFITVRNGNHFEEEA